MNFYCPLTTFFTYLTFLVWMSKCFHIYMNIYNKQTIPAEKSNLTKYWTKDSFFYIQTVFSLFVFLYLGTKLGDWSCVGFCIGILAYSFVLHVCFCAYNMMTCYYISSYLLKSGVMKINIDFYTTFVWMFGNFEVYYWLSDSVKTVNEIIQSKPA